jgi:purine-cytosine permease-like protein
VAAASICGYRRPTTVITLAIMTIAMTLVCVMGFGRLTGISTGLAPPIVLRTLAGSLAAALSSRWSIRRS